MSFKIESQEQKNMDVGTLNIPAFLIVQQIGKPSLLKALLNKDRTGNQQAYSHVT